MVRGSGIFNNRVDFIGGLRMDAYQVIDRCFETYVYYILFGSFILGGIGGAMLFWGYINEIEEKGK